MFSGAVHRGTGQSESHTMSTGHPEPAYHGCHLDSARDPKHGGHRSPRPKQSVCRAHQPYRC